MLERRTKYEDARSVQALEIQHSQRSGPFVVHLYDWLGTSGARLHPGEINGLLLLFVPKDNGPYFWSVCVLTVVCFVCVSKFLAPGKRRERWQSDVEMPCGLYGA